MVTPLWLTGCWKRSWIARGTTGSSEEASWPRTQVDAPRYYVQSPCGLFADVSEASSFAGMTVFAAAEVPPRISWHAALDSSTRPPFGAAMAAIKAGAPLATADQGTVEFVEGEPGGRVVEWLERSIDELAPEPYVELWRRVEGSGGRCAAAGRGSALLVVAGDRFCYAMDGRHERGGRGGGGGTAGDPDPPGWTQQEQQAQQQREAVSQPEGGAGSEGCSRPGAIASFAAGTVSSGWIVDVCVGGDDGVNRVGERLLLESLEGWQNREMSEVDGAAEMVAFPAAFDAQALPRAADAQ